MNYWEKRTRNALARKQSQRHAEMWAYIEEQAALGIDDPDMSLFGMLWDVLCRDTLQLRISNQLVFDIVNQPVRRLRDRLYAPDLTFGINHNFCALYQPHRLFGTLHQPPRAL